MIDVVFTEPKLERERWVAGLTDVGAGRVALIARPGRVSVPLLAGDILRELGIPYSEDIVLRYPDEEELLAIAWARAYRIGRLVVGHAEWIGTRELVALIWFAHAAELDLGLVFFGEWSDEQYAVTSAWSDHVLTWRQARPRLAAARGGDPALLTSLDLPLPALHYDALRLSAAADLPSSETAEREVAAIADWLLHDLTSEPEIAWLALSSVSQSVDVADALARLGAIGRRVAALGWDLSVDRDQVAGVFGVGSSAPSSQSWAALRHIRHPLEGACAALATSGCDIDDIRSVTIEDVSDDGRVVLVHGEERRIHGGGALFLRALRTLRELEAASWAQPLIAHRRLPQTRRGVRDLLGTATSPDDHDEAFDHRVPGWRRALILTGLRLAELS